MKLWRYKLSLSTESHCVLLPGIWVYWDWLRWMLWEVFADTLYPQNEWNQQVAEGNRPYLFRVRVPEFWVVINLTLLKHWTCVCVFVPTQPGDVWSMSGNTCESYSCFRNGATYVTTRSKIQCPPFQQSNCQPVYIVNMQQFQFALLEKSGCKKYLTFISATQQDSIQTAANGCCKICE